MVQGTLNIHCVIKNKLNKSLERCDACFCSYDSSYTASFNGIINYCPLSSSFVFYFKYFKYFIAIVTAKLCVFFIIIVAGCILSVSFNFFPWYRVKNKNCNT